MSQEKDKFMEEVENLFKKLDDAEKKAETDQEYAEKIKAINAELESIIDKMMASKQAPPVFVARFLRLDEKIQVQIPGGEGDKPKSVEVQTAVVTSRREGEQTIVVDPGVDLEKLQFGQKVWVQRIQGEFTNLLKKECPIGYSGQEKIVVVQRVLSERNVLIKVDGKILVVNVAAFCEELQAGDRILFDQECDFIVAKAPQIEEEVDRKTLDPVTYKDVGGLEGVIEQLLQVVRLPFEHPELFEATGTKPPKSVLLTGEPGTGKTLLARATANETDMPMLARSGSQFTSEFTGGDIAQLELLFDEAEKMARDNKGVIIFVDEVESLFPRRDQLHIGQHDLEARANYVFARMEGLRGRGNVIIIAATNQPDKLDGAAHRRFDKIIEVPVPSDKGRLEILKIHTRAMKLADDVVLEEIVPKTHGFVGDDIERLCMEAALSAHKIISQKLLASDEAISQETLTNLAVGKEHFMQVLAKMRPSGLGSSVITDTRIKFKDVGGLGSVKEALIREIQALLNKGELYRRAGIKPQKGILLWGWPGCGKTYLARAFAGECGMNFISVKGSEIHSMWFGESERNLRAVFRMARLHSPVVIFLDEIDSMFPRRGSGVGGTRVSERLVAAFNVELDGIEELQDVIVLAATNRIDLVDPAVIRRLCGTGEPVLVPELDKEGRQEVFKIHTKGLPLADDVDFDELAEFTGKRWIVLTFQDRTFKQEYPFNGDEIRGVCESAVRIALQEFEKEYGDRVNELAANFFVWHSHFQTAINRKLHIEKESNGNADSGEDTCGLGDGETEKEILGDVAAELRKKVEEDLNADVDFEIDDGEIEDKENSKEG